MYHNFFIHSSVDGHLGCFQALGYMCLFELRFSLSTCPGFPLAVKNLPAKAEGIRDVDSTPKLGRSPGGGHGNPLQYSCLENPMERGAWWTTVHSVAQS